VYHAFAHYTYDHFKNIVSQGLTYKSILKFDEEYFAKHCNADLDDVSIIVNTYYDLEYSKKFALDNKNIQKISEDRRFFLDIGKVH